MGCFHCDIQARLTDLADCLSVACQKPSHGVQEGSDMQSSNHRDSGPCPHSYPVNLVGQPQLGARLILPELTVLRQNAQEGQWKVAKLGAREGGRTLRKDVFPPSKHLLSAFYETLSSKNASKNLVFP